MASQRLTTFTQARKFIAEAGFCLRYGANDSLPIPSLYQAVLGKSKDPGKDKLRIAIALTNELLGKHEAIEVNVIAGRVCLVHRSLMPALYQLIVHKSKTGAIPKLSSQANEVLRLLQDKGEIVTGDVRKLFGIPSSKTGEDPAYAILGELQTHLLIDRGPFKISNESIPYLAKEGYPYHLFTEVHGELAKLGDDLGFENARDRWLLSFLRRTPSCTFRKMGSMFKIFLTPKEIENGIEFLISCKKIKSEGSG